MSSTSRSGSRHDEICPFRPGDIVVYAPSERGRMLAHHTTFESLVPGHRYSVARVVDDRYILPAGYEYAVEGGLYWTEFRRA